MRNKVGLLVICTMLVTNILIGCGKEEIPAVVQEQATSEVTEEIKAVEEASEAFTEAPAEEVSTEEASLEESTNEEVKDEAKEAASKETSKDEAVAVATSEAIEESTVATTDSPKAKESTKTESATSTGYIIDKYIADGDFSDFRDYGTAMGASATKISSDEWNVDFYFNGYIIAIGTNLQDPDYSYVGTGTTNGAMQYATLIPYKNVSIVPVSASGTFVPVETCHKLEETINYMKTHTDVTQKPSISGMEWKSWAELTGG